MGNSVDSKTSFRLRGFDPGTVEGSLRVVGFWDAATNTPNLSTLTLQQGQAYQVSVPGSTSLNGETNWKARDLVVWDDNLTGNYFKIDNTDDVLEAPIDGKQYARFNGSWSEVVSGGTNFANVLFVDPNGNDGTGAKGDNTKPFLTLEAARDAATTGDTVIVNTGTYTTTSNLAKDGIVYYFHPETYVTKSNTGIMFDLNGFTTNFSIYGYGNFEKNTTSENIPLWRAVAVNFPVVFEGVDITNSSGGHVIEHWNSAQYGKFKFRNVLSTGNAAFFITQSNSGLIEATSITALTQATVVNNGYNSTWTVNASYIRSTGSYAIHAMGSGKLILNAAQIQGVATIGSTIYSIYTNIQNSRVAVNAGFVTGWRHGGGMSSFNGYGQYLYTDAGGRFGGNFNGGSFSKIDCIQGTVYTTLAAVSNRPIVSMLGGNMTLNGVFSNSGWSIGVGGGKLEVLGSWASEWDGEYFTVYDTGTLIVRGSIDYNPTNVTALSLKRPAINITSPTAKVVVNGGIIKVGREDGDVSCIQHNAGTLVLNNATLITPNENVYPIKTTAAGLNVKILSGGVNTNRTEYDLLAAKVKKTSHQVTATGGSQIRLNDSVNTITFNSNTGTVDGDAADLTNQINASVLNLTASHTLGNDFFEIESDIAGDNYGDSLEINITSTLIKDNSYSLSGLTGGQIIQDEDVE